MRPHSQLTKRALFLVLPNGCLNAIFAEKVKTVFDYSRFNDRVSTDGAFKVFYDGSDVWYLGHTWVKTETSHTSGFFPYLSQDIVVELLVSFVDFVVDFGWGRCRWPTYQ